MMNIYEENLEICILCRQGAAKGDRYYVRTDIKAAATELLRKIPRYLTHLFDYLPTAHVSNAKEPSHKFPFCCRTCKKLLEKRQNQVENLTKVENDIRLRRGSSARRIAFTDVTCSTPENVHPFTCNVSPIAFPTTCTSSTVSSSSDQVAPGHKHQKEAQKVKSPAPPECGVKVVVTWPSQVKQRKLKTELEPVGKALLNGTWSNIAGAVFRVKELKVELCKFFLKEIGKECCAMVSKKNLSLLRKTSSTEMQRLSLANLSNELKTRCPLLYSVLMTAGTTGRKKNNTESWLPSVVVAASVVLKQRCRDVNTVQLIITTLIKYTGFHSMCKFLSALKLGVSPSFYNKKSDELGLLYNAEMLKQKKEDESVLMSCFGEDQIVNQNLPSASQLQVSESQTVDEGVSIGTPVSESVNTVVAVQQSGIGQGIEQNIPCVTQAQVSQEGGGVSIGTPVSESVNTVVAVKQSGGQAIEQNIPCVSQAQVSQGGAGGESTGTLVSESDNTGVAVARSSIGPGWKIAFDNIDIYQRVREMTEDNQNKDLHWVNHVKITNRVSGNHLPDDKPILDSVMQLDNCRVIPSVPDHISQRGNYIVLIERILTNEIACVSFCKDVVAGHIPHCHPKEMMMKSEKESLGIIFHDENTTDGINETLHQLHSYVPQHTSQGKTVYNKIGVVGDQLSVERALNCLSSLGNGFTAEERLDGLHLEIADWHAELKFLSLIYQRFYSTLSANDKCTLFADRNAINRRNVKADAHHAYAPNKQMFVLADKARIVAAAMLILGIEDVDGNPTEYPYPKDASKTDKTSKRIYLRNLASKIVRHFIVDEKAYNSIIDQALQDFINQQAHQAEMTPDGHFPCRHSGCDKSFRHDGQHRRRHEQSMHNLYIDDSHNNQSGQSSTSPSDLEYDDMFNYQCNLLEHGLLYLNFNDAVAEGDGDRIIRCWKFLLLHFYHDSGSTKYALEALYLQLQQQALLSPRQAYRQRWNRSVNNHGGSGKNVPIDLEVEHDNNSIKEGIRKLGPNLTRAAVTRTARMLPVARGVVHNVSRECNLMKRSGKHFVKTTRKDLLKIVSLLLQANALRETPGRHYKHFKQFPKSPLHGLKMGKMCKWINKHKHELQIGRKAR